MHDRAKRHQAAAKAARKLAGQADHAKLSTMLRMYADDVENDGRAHAPQWMREAADRIDDMHRAMQEYIPDHPLAQ